MNAMEDSEELTPTMSVRFFNHSGGRKARIVIGRSTSVTAGTPLVDDVPGNGSNAYNSAICLADDINRELDLASYRRDVREENHAKRSAREEWGEFWRRSRIAISQKAREFISGMVEEDGLGDGVKTWDGNGNPVRYLYFLMRGKKIVYVGQASSLKSRVTQHRRDKHFDGVKYMLVSREHINDVERRAITHLCPEYNVDHNPGLDGPTDAWGWVSESLFLPDKPKRRWV